MRGIVIAFLLLFSLSAQGQFIIDSYRFGAPALLLDDYPNAAAAYSLRLLRTAYTGNALTVTKDNGDTTLIAFSGGYLDTAAMKTFCGTAAGDSCRVRRLFDQSGNGRNFAQDTFERQPLIMSDGVVLRDNGEVSLRFDGVDDRMSIPSSTAMFDFVHNGSDATFFSVQRFGISANPEAAYNLLDNGGNSAGVGFSTGYDDRITVGNNGHRMLLYRGVGGSFVINTINANTVTPNVIGLLYSKVDADNATAANRHRGGFNGSADYGDNTQTNAVSGANATYNLFLGSNPLGQAFLLGAVQELIIYNADQSTNRTAIETNINNFYSIY
jgi:hypothetical protein